MTSKKGPKIRIFLPTAIPNIVSDFLAHKQKPARKRRKLNNENKPSKEESATSLSIETENNFTFFGMVMSKTLYEQLKMWQQTQHFQMKSC